ncbi:inositol monophosphatase family protein [Ruegeria conchae]|uniref:inositol monophosphatase family protein n=1 Tax=Ruegeria conchae TaxID=981384 RepID=UPI0021A57F17|nr:inositol monophosphatase family protein [Ruegeria conchae]
MVRSTTDGKTHAEHATQIAALAADAARGYFRGRLGVEFKTDESPVTQADKGVETIVRAYLAEHFPEDGIFGEEQGAEGLNRDHVWIIDPIDGTRSFLSGHPLFGFLLGLLVKGEPLLGVIGMPALNECLLGIKGQGAMLNGQSVSVSGTESLSHAVFFVNEGDKIYRDHPDLFRDLMHSGQTRRFAYDCYPHALVAMGHVDAVIDYDLQPYDFLPVAAVIEAAGGVITDWNGNPLNLNSDGRVISAATPVLHAELLAMTQGR